MGLLDTASAALENMAAMLKRGDETAASRLSIMWGEDREGRRPAEGQWQTNISFTLGNQWVQWDTVNFALVDLMAPSSRKRSVDNRIYPKVRSAVTRRIASMTVEVLPNGPETQNIAAARHKENVARATARNTQFEIEQIEAAIWAEVCGMAYYHIDWDEDAGEMYADDSGLITEGEVMCRTRSPFEVWPGAACSRKNWGYRVWTGDMMHVDIARAKYNSREIAADAGSLSDTRFRARLSGYFSAAGSGNIGGEIKKLKDMVLVLRCYELRSRVLPQGRDSVFINGKVMEERPLSWFPLVPIRAYPYFESFYGDTVVRQALGPQKTLNLNLSAAHQYVRTMKPKIMAHVNCKIRHQQWDSESDEIVQWSGPGPAPSAFNPPPIPPDTWNIISHETQVIEDLFAEHPASQGRLPGGRTSGSAINYLTEEDARQHIVSQILWNDANARAFEKMLDVAASRYDEGRLMTVVGEDKKVQIFPYKQELMAGKNRVIVTVGDGLPQNKTLRSEIVRRRWVDGYYGEPQDPKVRALVQKLDGSGMVADLYNDTLLDEMRAEKENMEMAAGTIVVPNMSDNDDIHLQVHYRDMKTDEYRALDEILQDLREIHCEQHEQRKMMKMMTGAPPPPQIGNPNGSASAPAASGPESLQKEVAQGAEPPPPPGAM